MRWWIIWLLLTKKERDLIAGVINSNKDYAINEYAECMGETYHEFTEELIKMSSRL